MLQMKPQINIPDKTSRLCFQLNQKTKETAKDRFDFPPPQDSLEKFAPVTHPRIPRLIQECVTEIERRGLQEVS